MQALYIYLVLINAVSFVLMIVDKRRARKNLWRIRESTLLGAAAMGGSLGALVGMYLVRHKTRHLKFTVGVPILFFVHVLIGMWLLMK